MSELHWTLGVRLLFPKTGFMNNHCESIYRNLRSTYRRMKLAAVQASVRTENGKCHSPYSYHNPSHVYVEVRLQTSCSVHTDENQHLAT